MWYWEVVWMDEDDRTHSMYALRGKLRAIDANREFLTLFPAVRETIKSKGGKILAVADSYHPSRVPRTHPPISRFCRYEERGRFS